MNKTKEQLEVLLIKYLDKSCSFEELKELFSYINDPEYQTELEAVLGSHFFSMQPIEDHADLDWEAMFSTITSSPSKRTRPLWGWVISAAAILLAVLSIGIFAWNKQHDPVQESLSAVSVKKDLAPGGNKAVLRLANGKEIVLETSETGILASEGSTRISKTKDGMLIYDAGVPLVQGDAAFAEPLINTLITPKGGQFMLILPDHSKVWLNSGSSLSYPSAFNGTDRTVELTGEAYFEITKNNLRPFKVKVGAAEVSVLGTHFNIMAYANERSTQVSLAEGSVRVGLGRHTQLLKPGQQALINAGGDEITLKHVDLDEVTSWKNGLFQFDNTPIEHVMRQIARWYAVDVVYEGTKPDLSFTGIVSRNNNVSKILELIEETGGVDFEIKDKEIVVKTSKRR